MSRRPSVRWLWALAPAVLALVGWGWWASFRSVAEARHELRQLEERRETLAEENRALRSEIDGLRQEPEARAGEARRTLALGSPDEVLVVLPTPTPEPSSTGRVQ